MFDKIKDTIRGWLSKLGIIKELNDIRNHKKAHIDEEEYNRIALWTDLYRGYPEDGEHEYSYKLLSKSMTRRLLTVNMPKMVAKEMATLVFNEKVEFNVDNDIFDDYLQTILKDNKFYYNMQSHYERALATSGMVIKPYVQDSKIKLSFVSALNFFPTSWENGNVKEGFFTNRFKRGKYHYTHLEWHEWENERYRITNELYRSEYDDKLGIRVSLTEAFDELEEVVYFNGLDKNTMFVYIKPNEANNFNSDSPLGVSIYANALDTIYTIDRMIDSLNREFVLGKKRIIVPANMVKTVTDNNGNLVRYFDTEDETYEAFNGGGDMEANNITDIKVELRVEEHIRAIELMLKFLASQTGFSSGTFSFEDGGVKTATEVVSEQSKTFKTKQSHEVLLAEAFKDLVDLIAYLTQAFNLGAVPEYEVAIKFDDSIAEDKTAEQARIITLVQNKLMPKIKAIAKVNGLTDEEAQEWLEMIDGENQMVSGGDVGLFGDE